MVSSIVRDRGARRDARVDPALEPDDEDRLVEVGVREEDDAVVDFVVHHFPPKSVFASLGEHRDMRRDSPRRCPGHPPSAPAR